MANQKISDLTEHTTVDGNEYVELIVSPYTPGTNRKILSANLGLTRQFDRTWSADLLFDKTEIAYEEHTLTGDTEFTVQETGNITNKFSSIVQEIITDGTHQITFTGFKYVQGSVQSGDTPVAGTYQVFFLYYNGIATAIWNLPTSEVANLTPLLAPANFAAVLGTDPETEVDLSWDAVANVSSYELYYSVTSSSGPWIALTPPGAGDTTFGHTGLTPGTTYYYRIRAIGDQIIFGNSGYSTDATTTENAAAPGAPTFTFAPPDLDTNIPVNAFTTITASDPIRDQDGVTVITDANLGDYVTVEDSLGNPLAHTKTIDATKTIITITPTVSWPPEDDVVIEISGVESSVNSVHGVTVDATFGVSSYTLMQNNYLDHGDILDTIFAANDADFNLKFTAKDLIVSGSSALVFRKYVSPGQRSFYVTQVNDDLIFKWYGGPEPSVPIREITWANCLDTGEHDYDIAYRGAVDTNNGLDRLTLKIDTVTQGGKSVTEATLSWPFNLQNTTAPLLTGPSIGQIKDIIITSANDTVTELNVPIVRTGLDTSGNARHGTWN